MRRKENRLSAWDPLFQGSRLGEKWVPKDLDGAKREGLKARE